VTRFARAAGRLADGSSTLARRTAARTAAWVARARRDDLSGWRASLGCWLRILLLTFGMYLLWRIVRALPALMWLLSAAWTAAAWRAGRPVTDECADDPAEAPTEQPDGAPRGDVRAATLEWIWQQIGDRQGVHLRDLLAHAQAHGMFEGLEVGEFRAHLERWEIPVRARVRVRGLGVTVGIHRDDLPAPLSPSPEAAPSEAA
jgi:hypothetical protein